ncbi:phosphotransferase family protein [Halomarina salina]|uniref:Phosphotransferase family protein n=1 Tax=Halomarina salina TaxID=1872699 RepID=A0ABD5RQ08_9EURY|nr:phosphotransferase family protein [Halomarina salina]
MTGPETTALDTSALESYLATELGVDVAGTETLSDGLNLVVAVATADDPRAYVVRRPNKLRESGLFVAIEQEYAVLERLDGTAVPTPSPVAFCDDEPVLGGAFVVTTYAEGVPFPRGTDLPERYRTPSARRRIGEQLVDTLATIHSLDTDPFDDVCERLTPQDQISRAVERLDVATTVTGREYDRLRDVADWLGANVPEPPTTTLVHGDYRAGNVLFAGDDPELTAVLDWETAMLGDPFTELGYFLLDYRDESDSALPLGDIEAHSSDEAALEDVRQMNERGLSPYTADPGSPSREDLVARYEANTGITFEHERFYRAKAAFVLATVWADLDRHRVESGGAPTRNPYVDYMAVVAQHIAEDGDDR